MPKVKRMRDITRALYLAKIVRDAAGDAYSPEINDELVNILETLDGRTGKREKGQGPALTPVGGASAVKRAAKKAGARTR